MDPFLEHPALWPGLHTRLPVVTVEVLQPQLRERGYYADANERVWLTEPGRAVYPDSAIYRRSDKRDIGPSQRQTGSGQAGGLVADEPVMVSRVEVEVRQSFVEIFDVTGNRLITGIGFVSPTNKSDTKGRELYERKRRETAEAGVNLVEVDLLRSGRHLLDVPLSVVEGLKPWDYLVNILRPNQEEYEFYPIPLRDRLPCIRIPLKPGESDAVLDLQAVLDRAYDLGPYPDRIDYTAEATPPLARNDAEWSDRILKECGLRTADK